jgi:uncharacterized protein
LLAGGFCALTCAVPADNILYNDSNLKHMLEVIEKLLILQDRDRNLIRVSKELDHVQPQREDLQFKAQAAQQGLEAAKHRIKEIETRRRDLELQVELKKQQIERYSIQQFQTKKNEEYRALGKEIDSCKAEIVRLEDQQLELMEQAEAAQAQASSASREATEAKKLTEDQLARLAARQENLEKELATLNADREQLAQAVEETARARYTRLLKSKGATVLVGIQHGVCGGCHMRLPTHVLLQCKADEDLVSCPNCGRILYYTRDMDMAVAD